MARRWKCRVAAALALLLTPAGAGAAPCDSPEFRSWDFWVGEWDVFDAGGKRVGGNRIERIEEDCGLLETWTAPPVTGRSLNTFDPVRRTWTQLWIGGRALIRLEGAPAADGVLAMSGTITDLDKRTTHDFRGEWRRLPSGEVRQHFEERDPATGAWKPWFTGLYRRKS
jgi:hypothetical protein